MSLAIEPGYDVAALAAALAAVVGDSQVLTDPTLTSSYETDWTGRFAGRAALVVRPASTEEVVACLLACAAAGAPVVVQGGNTGLVGGGVPDAGGAQVLLSLTRLNALEPIDIASGQVTVGAGVRLADLQAHARAAGLDFGVDLAARDSATVGGLIATNAGGIRVLRYGSMHAQLLGLEVVMADGTITSRLGGLPKDNTGYDLTALLTGSEGTLGVITRARLRLVPREPARAVALVAVADTAAAIALLGHVRGYVAASLSAAEIMYAPGVELVRAGAALPPPFESSPFGDQQGTYLVLECAARNDPTDALLEALSEAPEVLDANVATAGDPGGQRALWAYREGHTEAVNAAGVPVKLDVAVPLGQLPAFVAELPALIAAAAPDARTYVWGHLNEGNLHVNVVGALAHAEAVEAVVLRAVAARQGTISSEHGIGRAKTAWLELSRTPSEIAVMCAVKAALDPAGMLGPGVLFAG